MYQDKPVCSGNKTSILYIWARNAPRLNLPKGVAFKVGRGTGIKYLVIQVHYKHLDKDFDATGVKVKSFFQSCFVNFVFNKHNF